MDTKENPYITITGQIPAAQENDDLVYTYTPASSPLNPPFNEIPSGQDS